MKPNQNNGNGVITWRVIGVAGWIVVWALMYAGINDISIRVRALETSISTIQGQLQMLIREDRRSMGFNEEPIRIGRPGELAKAKPEGKP